MKSATFALALLVAVAAFSPAETAAGIPDGKLAVVRVTAVDGFAHRAAESETRTSTFDFDGTEYHIDRSALTSLDGVQTLLLIDRRTDELGQGTMVQRYTQEVRAFNGTAFEVKDLKGKVLSYQVAMLGGNLRLLGDGDQILAMGGTDGPYQVWRVDGISLVDREAVILQ
jgi:hypothetical protein